MIMRSDGLSPAAFWHMIEKARVHLAARTVKVALAGATAAIA